LPPQYARADEGLDVHQLTYISTARKGLIDSDIDAILTASRRNNRLANITGLLVHDGVRFLQALEGELDAVETTFLRIKTDQRHRAAVMLSLREVAGRQFGTWDMACERVSARQGRKNVADLVDSLVADLPDANTRAAFTSFARIDRLKVA
jgi:hypothetical protein